MVKTIKNLISSNQAKSVRIGARIKPEYKDALELIARDRQTSLSEVLELAIYKLADQYKIDGIKVTHYVNDPYYLPRAILGTGIYKPLTEKEKELKTLSIMKHLPPKNTPISLISPKERYIAEILREPLVIEARFTINGYALISFIVDGWEKGIPAGIRKKQIILLSDHIKQIRDNPPHNKTDDMADILFLQIQSEYEAIEESYFKVTIDHINDLLEMGYDIHNFDVQQLPAETKKKIKEWLQPFSALFQEHSAKPE